MQATPHLHILVPETVWREDATAVALCAPDEAAVEAVLVRTVKQVAKDWAEEDVAHADDEYEGMQQQALQLPQVNGHLGRRGRHASLPPPMHPRLEPPDE